MQGQGRVPQPLPQVAWDKPAASQPPSQPLRTINPNVSAQQLPTDPWDPSLESQDTRAGAQQGPSGSLTRGPGGMPLGAAHVQQVWQAQQAQRAGQHAQRGPYIQGQGPAKQPYMPHLVGQAEGAVPQHLQHGPNLRQQQQQGPGMGQVAVQPAPGLQTPHQVQQQGQQAHNDRQPGTAPGEGDRQQGQRQPGQGQRAGRRSPPQSQRAPQTQPQPLQAHSDQTESERLPGPPPRPLSQPQQQRQPQAARRVIPINPTSSAPGQGQGPSSQLPGPPPQQTQGHEQGQSSGVLPGPPSLPQPARPPAAQGQGQGSLEHPQQGPSGSGREERSHDHLSHSREGRAGRARGGRFSRDRSVSLTAALPGHTVVASPIIP